MSTGDRRIAFIKKFMTEKDYNQSEMADKLDVSRQYLNLILNGNKPITSKLAIKLARLTPRSTDFWYDNGSDLPPGQDPDASYGSWIKGGRPLVDHEIEEAMERGLIGIDPYLEANLEPMSYSLTIGRELLLSHEDELIDLKEYSPIHIQPNNEAALITQETIKLSPHISGNLYPTTKIIDNNVSMNHGGLVHPGYHGKLYFTLHNYTQRPVSIDIGTRVVRLVFTYLPVAPNRPYQGDRQGLQEFPPKLMHMFKQRGTRTDAEQILSKLDVLIQRTDSP